MIFSDEDLANTPSRRDGIPEDEEFREKREGLAMVKAAVDLLGLPKPVLVSACYYFHRFYAMCSLKKFEVDRITSACLLLASKVEEKQCRISEIVHIVRALRHPRPGSEDLFPDITPSKKEGVAPVAVGDEYYDLKQQVIADEQAVLRSIAFKVEVDKPHKFLYNYVKAVRGSQNLGKLADAVLNDSLLRTALCLRFPPEELAAGALHLASLMLQEARDLPRVGDACWWDMMGIQLPRIEACGTAMMDMLLAAAEATLAQPPPAGGGGGGHAS